MRSGLREWSLIAGVKLQNTRGALLNENLKFKEVIPLQSGRQQIEPDARLNSLKYISQKSEASFYSALFISERTAKTSRKYEFHSFQSTP